MKIEKTDYCGWGAILSSGDGDEYPGCKLIMKLKKYYVTFCLPPIIKPERRKAHTNWDEETVKRLGRNWYWNYLEKRYGWYLFENHFNIMYGREDANFDRDKFGPEQRWSCFLPWCEWRFVRHSLYDTNGRHFATRKDTHCSEEMRDACPSVTFTFLDFDGENISAKTRIEEREWLAGTGLFKWLSWFRSKRISRSLDIWFSNETGRKKGSWKGGVVGTSIEMLSGELHEQAFKRYCESHNMTFVDQEVAQ